jgi:uncharacterized protein YbjT (DUF2867 family)
MNLVVGATGLLGTEICRRLASDRKPLRALVRTSSDPAKVAALETLGATLIFGDLKDSAALDGACDGVSTVISTASSTFSRQEGDSIESVDSLGQLNLVRAAAQAGVRHFIFISFPTVGVEFALQRAKRSVEKALAESGLAYTILQPTFFTEIWLSPAVGFDTANASATIYGSGQNKISFISYSDVARFSAASVDNLGAYNKTIKLGGPEPLSPSEVVSIFEEVGGRKFDTSHVPEETLQVQRAAAPDSLQEAFAALMIYYARGEVVDMSLAFDVFPITVTDLTSVHDFAKRALSATP